MSTSDVERELTDMMGPPPALSPTQIGRVVDGELAAELVADAPGIDVAFVDRPLPD